MKNKLILLASDRFGIGDDDLGATLLEKFLTLLEQREDPPAAIFCLNRGVFALTKQSFAALHLAGMAAAGVPVLACQTCVEHYGLADSLEVGQLSSMKDFVDLAATHEVVRIG